MRDYAWMYEYCLNRFGSREALEARLPQPKSAAELRAVGDDRYLSLISLRIFRAGLKHSLVDAKWPAFEEVFFGFDPQKVVLMSAEHLERLMQDARLIRHLGKLKSVPRNAQMVLDLAREHGSFGNFLADWPETDIVGLWKLVSKRGDHVVAGNEGVLAGHPQETRRRQAAHQPQGPGCRAGRLQPVARGERPAAVPAVGDAGTYGQSLS